MESTTFDLSWICIIIPAGIVIVFAILGTIARLRYARRIWKAQASSVKAAGGWRRARRDPPGMEVEQDAGSRGAERGVVMKA